MKRLVAAGAAGIAVGAALAALRYHSMRDALAEVPRHLRSPLLPFLTVENTALTVPVLQISSRFSTSSGPGVTVSRRAVPGRPPVRVHVTAPDRPATSARPAVLYLHAGGLMTGSPQAEAIGTGILARELDAVVVAPDYRLAPQHRFPAAIDDCMAVLHWMWADAAELGIDPDRIAVTGSSAGGGLSAVVAQRAFDEGRTLRAQALVYPMLDDRTALRTDFGNRGKFVWTPDSNRFGWISYLGREPRPSDSPEYLAAARRENLAGLPPAWVGVGDLDVLYDESVDYAERLRAAGVPCELVAVPGMYHGADGFAIRDPSMKAFRESLIDHLRTHLLSPAT